MEEQFTLAKCKTKAAYSAKLKKQARLDLPALKKSFTVVLDTPILLVLKINGVEVIAHSYGELLFKKCDDVALMKKIARKVYKSGLKK